MKHSHDNPEAIAKAIIRRLNEYHVNIPYAELARSAKELKLPQLAKLVSFKLSCLYFWVVHYHLRMIKNQVVIVIRKQVILDNSCKMEKISRRRKLCILIQ